MIILIIADTPTTIMAAVNALEEALSTAATYKISGGKTNHTYIINVCMYMV